MFNLLVKFKLRMYFVVGAYFGFWAKIVLRRWRPRIIVVTGSIGKTTLVHMVEAQLGDKAVYNHGANSAHGLPFFILGQTPNIGPKYNWLIRLFTAPIHAFRKVPSQKFFVVEADSGIAGEGKFLARFLKPEVTLWISVYRTHSLRFDKLVQSGKFPNHERAIAYEFGYFPAQTSKLVLANGDQPILMDELDRVKPGTEVRSFSLDALKDFKVQKDRTAYDLGVLKASLPGLHLRELGVSLQMVDELMSYLDLPLDADYANLRMPPGRTNVFAGQKDITIIDSTYNTGLGGTTAVLQMLEQVPIDTKWLVLGDILEQGSIEAEEHEKLAELIAASDAKQVVLLGPRVMAHTQPKLQALKPKLPIVCFDRPDEVLEYLKANLQGGEAVLFKGGRFLEGVIEQLLADPKDEQYLVRREPEWTKRRQKWGLPR